MKHIIFCSAVMATFIIDNPQCGGNRVDRAQIAAIYLDNDHYDQALIEARRALREEGPQTDLQLIVALAHMGLEEDQQHSKCWPMPSRSIRQTISYTVPYERFVRRNQS